MKVLVVKENPDGSQCYVGTPYTTEAQARRAVLEDFYSSCHIHDHRAEVLYSNNMAHIIFISEITGEIFADYFMLIVPF